MSATHRFWHRLTAGATRPVAPSSAGLAQRCREARLRFDGAVTRMRALIAATPSSCLTRTRTPRNYTMPRLAPCCTASSFKILTASRCSSNARRHVEHPPCVCTAVELHLGHQASRPWHICLLVLELFTCRKRSASYKMVSVPTADHDDSSVSTCLSCVFASCLRFLTLPLHDPGALLQGHEPDAEVVHRPLACARHVVEALVDRRVPGV